MNHIEQRLTERVYTNLVSKDVLTGLCYEYENAAVIIGRIDMQNDGGAYRTRTESNGDIVVLIIRDHKAITIMYRRSNQPMTVEALRVKEVVSL